MNTFGISEKSYMLLLQVLKQIPDIEKVIIFGSRAKDTCHKGSDIDLAISGPKLSVASALEISAILNEREPLPYHVDVVHYESIENKSLRDHIDRVGQIIPLFWDCQLNEPR